MTLMRVRICQSNEEVCPGLLGEVCGCPDEYHERSTEKIMKTLTQEVAALKSTEYGTEEYDMAAKAVWNRMSGAEREALDQMLFFGPIWDGNHISKSGRDGLIECGLAVRCCMMGEQGYTAATYPAYSIYRRNHDHEAYQRRRAAGRERAKLGKPHDR